MKATTKYVHLLPLLAVVLAPLSASAQEFSADEITHDSAGNVERSRVYRTATMIRAEATASPGNSADPEFLLIVDVAKQTSYSIISSRKAILVSHGKAALNKASIALPVNANPCMPITGDPPAANTACKKLSEETVNGRQTVKWEMSVAMGGQSTTLYLWVDPNLRCIVKEQALQSTVEFQNIREGPQPASLFALPAGYQMRDVGGR
jgi:hypothetical protein